MGNFIEYVDYNGPLVTDKKKIAIWPELAGTRCHDYIPCRGKNMPGSFRDNHRIVKAYRYAWKLKYGIYPKLNVCHKCDRRCCVNVQHLFLGTHKQNSEDMVAKGRSAFGEKHGTHIHPELIPKGEQRGNSKLKDEEIPKLLADWATGNYYQWELAEKYRVSPQTVSLIVNNKRWKHISGNNKELHHDQNSIL